MKLFTKVVQLGALTAMATAIAVPAQKEQWLDYHINREGRGYHMLNLRTNPPPDIKAPKCNAPPYFAHWVTPMDPKGRWICLDRTKKSGLYDRLYIDSNGDGRLDDETPYGTYRLDQYSANFEPAKVVFKGEDGPVAYHLVIRFMQYGEGQINCYASSGGAYAGKVDIGGKKRSLELMDSNVNGTFNDTGTDMGEADCMEIAGDKLGRHYLGKLLEVDGQFYNIEVARDGAFIKLQKAENVELGKVRVPETISEFVAFGPNGHFMRKPAKGEFTLPIGKYRIQDWKIVRKDERGASWELSAYNFNETARFEVAADKAASLKVGEPMRAVMELEEPRIRPGSREGTSARTFSLRFEGNYGETLQIMKGNQRPKGPRLTLTSLDGAYRYTNSFEFG